MNQKSSLDSKKGPQKMQAPSRSTSVSKTTVYTRRRSESISTRKTMVGPNKTTISNQSKVNKSNQNKRGFKSKSKTEAKYKHKIESDFKTRTK